MELYTFLKHKRLFTDEECLIIDNAFQREIIPKGTSVLKADRYSQKVVFIESGLLRTFYLKDGKDITHFFFDENFLVVPLNSIFYNRSEPYEWEAIEQCQIRTIQYDKILKLQDDIPKLTNLLLDFAINMLHLLSQKLNLLQFQTADERYHIFLEMYPNLLNRVSLGSTASFIGITQQTLSVIRAKKN